VDARNPEKKKPALLLLSAGLFELPNQLTGDFSSFRFLLYLIDFIGRPEKTRTSDLHHVKVAL
jgi:hypothetical protein